MEPQWSSDNKLMYISDQTGWWNLYQVGDDHVPTSAVNICPMETEIGGPCWQFGNCSYSPHPTNKDIVAVLYGKVSALKLGENMTKLVIRPFIFWIYSD